ncbi:MAG: MFS transporter [Pseudohongiellaceae bacterium]
MLSGAAILVPGLIFALPVDDIGWLLPVWAWQGVGFSTVQTPVGRVLIRSSHGEDRPALFAAQFSLSHAGWLVSYPLAGWLGSIGGMDMTLIVLVTLALLALIPAIKLWPAEDPKELWHSHEELPDYHPHITANTEVGRKHRHFYVIDDLHSGWPH